MAGKKQKVHIKSSSASKAKRAPSAKPAAKASAKATPAMKTGGALSSIKKMLGIGVAKGKPGPSKPAAKSLPKSGKAAVGKPTAKPDKTSAKQKAPAPLPVAATQAKGGKATAKTSGQEPQQANAQAQVQKKGRRGATPSAIDSSFLRATRASGGAEPIATGAPVCREVACELMATTGGYCRMHYIKNWKKVKRKELILKERKLNGYIEELVSKYPDKYIEAIRQDLASEKDFSKVIADLEIDEGLDDFESVETESAEGIIDNIKREFDDDGDTF